jgi:hypothetical protein
VAAFCLLAFVVVHVFEVIVTGLWNNLRSMITGYYRLPENADEDEAKARHEHDHKDEHQRRAP